MTDNADDDAIVVTNGAGHRLYLDPRDARAESLVAHAGDVNPDSLLTWKLALAQGPWDLVVDVGANYGEMIANADLSDAARIVAFEPNPGLLPFLNRTARELPWDVEVEPVALGNSEAGTALLTVDLDWSGSSTLKSGAELHFADHNTTTSEVPVTTLDAFLRGVPIDRMCVKIDVEGAELDVLLGASGTLDRVLDALVMIEILHLSVQEIAMLARRYPMFVLDTADQRLVRVHGKNRLELGQQLHSGRLNRQDAILVAGSRASELASELRRSNKTRATAEPEEPPRRAVYTALLGGYEVLQEQPMASRSEIPFICLTDDPSLTSETWDVRVITPSFPLDMVRSARELKILGHELLAGYNQTIWIDNRVTLTARPEELFALLGDADLVAFEHSFRDSLIGEFDAVVNGGYDDPARVYEQLIHYAELAPHLLDEKPIWTGLLVRKVSATSSAAMRMWMNHVLRYSRRDQLSAPFALAAAGVRVSYQTFDNRESPWHVWPPLGPGLGRMGPSSRPFQTSIRSPLARLREIEPAGELTALAQQQSAERRDELIKKLSSDLERIKRELREVRGSRSFKLAQRISRIRSLFPRRRPRP